MATDVLDRVRAAAARVSKAAARRCDRASLVAFRIAFGLIGAAVALRILAHGWVESLYGAQLFHFTYPGFSWVRPLPAPWLHVHVAVVALAGLAVAAGFAYRTAIVVFAVGLAWLELIDRVLYLNHHYLLLVLAGMLALLPLGRRGPGQIPAWVLWALRTQIGLVYAFAGIAKLNADWLFEAQPLRIWLQARADLPLLGPWLTLPPVAYLAAWAGAAFDLGIVPLLLWQRTRRYAFAGVVVFHVATALLFSIGVFPWLMIAAATLFFAPGWPRALARRAAPHPVLLPQAGEGTWEGGRVRRGESWLVRTQKHWLRPRPVPGSHWLRPRPVPRSLLPPAREGQDEGNARMRISRVVLSLHLAVQLSLPIYQHLTADRLGQRGFDFAWKVMLAESTGSATFTLVDPVCGRRTRVDPLTILTPTQAALMPQNAALVRAFAQHLAARVAAAGHPHLEVETEAWLARNGHPAEPLYCSKQ